MEDADFATLLNQARAGDEAAIGTLLKAFEEDVRMMVRARLPRVLRSQFDSMDFVQAVWKSVLADGGQVGDFANPAHFRGFLAGVARNKVFEAHRRGTTRKFDLGREEPLYLTKGSHEAPRDLPSDDPSPSQIAVADECWDRLVGGRTPQEAQVVDLRLQGLTFDEIARRIGLNERSVRRVIEAARKRVGG
jgi:RNA polymerase sigma-70 factor (ECF subfamily)